MSDRPLQYDPSSTRECLECGHPVAHDVVRVAGFVERCRGDHTDEPIADCPNAVRTYISRRCDCTENDRLIADLRAELAEARQDELDRMYDSMVGR